MGRTEPVRELIARTEIVSNPDDFTIVSISRDEEATARRILADLGPFCSVTLDFAEVSVVLRTEDWERLRGRFSRFSEEGPYRLITFDIVLDLSIVGFLAAISRRLAEEEISVYALSTFLRDHILVKKDDADRASGILKRLIDECKKPDD